MPSITHNNTLKEAHSCWKYSKENITETMQHQEYKVTLCSKCMLCWIGHLLYAVVCGSLFLFFSFLIDQFWLCIHMQSLKMFPLQNKALGCILKYLASPNEVQNMHTTSNFQICHYGLFFSGLAFFLISLFSVRETLSEVTALACS